MTDRLTELRELSNALPALLDVAAEAMRDHNRCDRTGTRSRVYKPRDDGDHCWHGGKPVLARDCRTLAALARLNGGGAAGCIHGALTERARLLDVAEAAQRWNDYWSNPNADGTVETEQVLLRDALARLDGGDGAP